MISRIIHYGQYWDTLLFEGIFRRGTRGPWPTLMYWTSRSGDGPLYAALAAMLTASRAPGAGTFAAACLAAFAIELPLYKALKRAFKRARPCSVLPGVDRRVVIPDRYSFPSGHAAGAFLVAALVAALYPEWRGPAFGWAGAVGYSRVYNGVHYPADVAAGATLGLACAGLALAVVR